MDMVGAANAANLPQASAVPSLTHSSDSSVPTAMSSEVDEAMMRIQTEHRGVIGVVVTNSEGVIIRSTFNSQFDVVDNYQAVIVDIVDRARQIIRDNDELTFLKIRTKRVEYIVVPDKEYTLITLLNPSNESVA